MNASDLAEWKAEMWATYLVVGIGDGARFQALLDRIQPDPEPVRWTRTPPDREGWWWVRNGDKAFVPIAPRLTFYTQKDIMLICAGGCTEWSSAPVPMPEEPTLPSSPTE